MPELPDIRIYLEALERRIADRRLNEVKLASPFFLRSAEPPLETVVGRRVERLRRLGKRIAIGLEGDYWLVIHLMIAGRLQWRETARRPARNQVAAFAFDSGVLAVTEAGKKKRASLHVVQGERELAAHDPGGAEVFDVDFETFSAALTRGNHTLKRALTDPRILSGIGNAYSDEILHRARLSPVTLTQKLTEDELRRLYHATRDTLAEWTQGLREETGEGFPAKVTAFRDGMAVHGRYGEPCPDCGTAVQRIRYASNETNYCPRCQTGGRLLADRSLSRLLKADWPRDIDELERRRR